jgi:membrane-associated protein
VADLLTSVGDWAIALAGTPWVFVALWALAAIDGFFPPIPSESVIIALAALFIANDTPEFWFLGIAAAAGAFTGDQIAYSIGKHIPVRTLRFMQGERAQRALSWAEHALANRGASFIIAARYVPIGRVAVNMTAGATGYLRFRFSGLVAIAAVSWSAYSIALGVSAGVWLRGHPVLAVLVGVAGGLVLGVIVDQILSWLGGRRGRRGADAGDGSAEAAGEAAAGGAADRSGSAEAAADRSGSAEPPGSEPATAEAPD